MVSGLLANYIRIRVCCVELDGLWPSSLTLQGTSMSWASGLVIFFPALAYHFCLALPAAFTQPGDHLLAEPHALSLLARSAIQIFHDPASLRWNSMQILQKMLSSACILFMRESSMGNPVADVLI